MEVFGNVRYKEDWVVQERTEERGFRRMTLYPTFMYTYGIKPMVPRGYMYPLNTRMHLNMPAFTPGRSWQLSSEITVG